MTLIKRAMPPPPPAPASTLHPECVETARKALEVHQAFFQKHYGDQERFFGWGSYLHWFIIHVPFTPFIVVFCNIISTPSLATRQSDLSRLAAFLNTLAPKPGKRHTSEAAEKMFHLCDVLHRVATLYVDASSQADTAHTLTMEQQLQQRDQAQDELTGVGVGLGGGGAGGAAQWSPTRLGVGEFEPYLNALGMAAPGGGYGDMAMGEVANIEGQNEVNGGGGAGYPDVGGGDGAASLEHWFAGAQHLMGLLEEDLSFIQTL